MVVVECEPTGVRLTLTVSGPPFGGGEQFPQLANPHPLLREGDDCQADNDKNSAPHVLIHNQAYVSRSSFI